MGAGTARLDEADRLEAFALGMRDSLNERGVLEAKLRAGKRPVGYVALVALDVERASYKVYIERVFKEFPLFRMGLRIHAATEDGDLIRICRIPPPGGSTPVEEGVRSVRPGLTVTIEDTAPRHLMVGFFDHPNKARQWAGDLLATPHRAWSGD